MAPEWRVLLAALTRKRAAELAVSRLLRIRSREWRRTKRRRSRSPRQLAVGVGGTGYACNARPDLHTVCRSFPKISSALSAKVCGGSRSAKILILSARSDVPFDGARRGPWACTGGGRASGAAWSAREIESQVVATLAALAQNSTPSAAHFLKSHQLLVQKFAADRDRQKKGRVFARRAS